MASSTSYRLWEPHLRQSLRQTDTLKDEELETLDNGKVDDDDDNDDEIVLNGPKIEELKTFINGEVPSIGSVQK